MKRWEREERRNDRQETGIDWVKNKMQFLSSEVQLERD